MDFKNDVGECADVGWMRSAGAKTPIYRASSHIPTLALCRRHKSLQTDVRQK